MKPQKFLFFSPFAGIWPHSFPEALVAEALREPNVEITYVTCNGVLGEYCQTMPAFGLDHRATAAERLEVCRSCKTRRDEIIKGFGFRQFYIESLITDQDRSDIESFMESFNQTNFMSSSFRGIPIGEKSLFDTLLIYKKIDLEFSDSEWTHYTKNVRNSAYAICALNRLLARESFDVFFVFSAHVSTNFAACEVPRRQGIPIYNLHSGLTIKNRSPYMIIGKDSNKSIRLEIKKEWPRYRKLAATETEIGRVLHNAVSTIRSDSAFGYSPDTSSGHFKNVRVLFGIRPEQKIICATMSSYDEMFSSELMKMTSFGSSLFSNQLEWIRYLADFASRNKDVFLIVRVHPREFPNKREGVLSYHARELMKKFDTLPENVAINWPNQNLSIYDIAKHADVFLNAWSTAGVEMSLLGLPVVTYSERLIFYPMDLNYTSETLDGFERQIQQALQDGWNPEKIRLTFRWLAYLFCKAHFSLGNVPFTDNRARKGLGRRALGKVLRAANPTFAEKRDIRRRKPLDPTEVNSLREMVRRGLITKIDLDEVALSGKSASIESETAAIKSAMREIYGALYGEDFQPVPGTLSEKLFRFSELVQPD